MTHDYIYEGVWSSFNQLAGQQIIWTVPNNTFFFFVAPFIATLLTFASSRTWVTMSYCVARISSVSRTSQDVFKYEKISQFKALLTAFRSLRLLLHSFGGTSQRPASNKPSEGSPWIGFFAVVNSLGFLVAGVLIPYYFTYGALGEPEVKSTYTNHCIDLSLARNIPPNENILRNKQLPDALYDQCYNQRYRDPICNRILGNWVQEHLSVEEPKCPFQDETICRNDTVPRRWQHPAITPYYVGVNSKSKVALLQRLTCAPIHLDPFQKKIGKQNVVSVLDFNQSWPNQYYFEDFSMEMKTTNGQGSGLRLWKDNGPYDIEVLPHVRLDNRPRIPLQGECSANWKLLHPKLRREDGQSFVLVYRSGRTRYIEPIEDPILLARTYHEGFYVADLEATALGCVEQYSFCLFNATQGMDCTPFSNFMCEWTTILEKLARANDKDAGVDLQTVFEQLPALLSVFDYVRITPELLMSQYRRASGFVLHVNPKAQWHDEVEAWFLKAFFSTKIRIQNTVQVELRTPVGSSMMDNNEDSLCNRILLRDSRFTNIDWTGFCATIGSLLLLIFVSYYVAAIFNFFSRTVSHIITVIETLIALAKFLPKMPQFSINDLRRGWREFQREHLQSVGFTSWYGASGVEIRESDFSSADIDSDEDLEGYSLQDLNYPNRIALT